MGLGKQINPKLNSDLFHFITIEIQLDAFNDYLKITNDQIDENINKILKEYHKTPEEEIFMHFDEIEIYTKQATLNIYYSSIIISLYSLLEQAMNDFCKKAEENQSVLIKDISGSGIFQSRLYLEKIVGIDFSKAQSQWIKIQSLNKLRNLYVHSSNSILPKSSGKKTTNLIKQIPHIELIEHEEYYVVKLNNDKTIKHFISVISEFLESIYYL